MEKEIGGYLGLEQACGREFYEDLQAVNSGRNALLYILKAYDVKKLHIPRFLCDSVSELCRRENIPFATYGIDRNFAPLFEGELGEGEWLYLVNYYGQLTAEQVLAWKKRYERVILDNIQAFFCCPITGIPTVYSCRKFFGVPDGGYAACEAVLPLERDSSRDRMTHILGRFEESGSAYYAAFQRNDEIFYDLPLRKMSPITRNILRSVDYEAVRQKRNANYAVLEAALGEKNPLPITASDGPYCYPFYCENGMEVKRALAKKKIYVPTLWPEVTEQGSALERDYAKNILPLPVDQRYDPEDMKRIVEELRLCMKI